MGDWTLDLSEAEEPSEEVFEILQAEESVPEAEIELLASPEELTADATKTKHIFLLHGWSNTAANMEQWLSALKSNSIGKDRYIWNLTFDSKLAFPSAATKLLGEMKKKEYEGFSFNDVQILAFSMGGVVGRSLIAAGLPVTRLVSLCTPHLGLMDHVPPIDPGVTSLKKDSADLRRLNNHPKESQARGRYMFIAVQHTHRNAAGTWNHDHDTVVDGSSARGDGLGTSIKRHNVRVTYNGGVGVMPGDPHGKGQDPDYCGVALEFLR